MIATDASSAIQVQDLRKLYTDGLFGWKHIEALRGVSIAVGRGEIFGLLGPNGAGKTTLIKVLLGIVRATGGQATLLGLPAGSRAGRQQVGYLPEHHRLPRHHTANSALRYFGALSGLSGAEVKRRTPDLLTSVGLGDWGRTPIKKFSKGMLQRLGLAQAMLHDPQLLILDEPTDGVDPEGRTEMRAILQRLKGEGKTIFINSHLLQEVELVCDRVAILDRGLVLSQGSIQELTRQREAEVRLVLAGDEPRIRAIAGELSGSSLRLVEAGQFELVLATADQASIDRLIDRLRGERVSLITMTRTRQTLEEAFLGILRQARAK